MLIRGFFGRFTRAIRDQWMGALALFLVVSGGTAWAATYIVSSNSEVGPNTISGHKVTGSTHANIIAGSIAATDLVPSFYNEAWHVVADNPKTGTDPCPAQTAVFCGPGADLAYWTNYGDPFMGARFYRVAAVVHIEGLVKVLAQGDGSWAPIFVLPAGYRPAKDLIFSVDCRSTPTGSPPDAGDPEKALVTHGRIDVTANGAVIWHFDADGCDPHVYLSLSGINFRAEK